MRCDSMWLSFAFSLSLCCWLTLWHYFSQLCLTEIHNGLRSIRNATNYALDSAFRIELQSYNEKWRKKHQLIVQLAFCPENAVLTIKTIALNGSSVFAVASIERKFNMLKKLLVKCLALFKMHIPPNSLINSIRFGQFGNW